VATHSESAAEELWHAFRTLPSNAREQFMECLIGDEAIRQELAELLDSQLGNERSHESARPLDDVLAEIERGT